MELSTTMLAAPRNKKHRLAPSCGLPASKMVNQAGGGRGLSTATSRDSRQGLQTVLFSQLGSEEMLPAFAERRPRPLLNTLQYMGHPMSAMSRRRQCGRLGDPDLA